MNKVETAIILAAGKGERLRPVTEKIPKPLVSVNGTRIIETIIQGLIANGIENIIIVVGYLKEQFFVLKEKYPDLRFVENPAYDVHNNISSLYYVRDYLKNSIIIDGDQIINNNRVLMPEFKRSGYCARYTKEHTDEWLLTVENEIVKSCSRTGGSLGWQLYGISRWSEEDAKKLKSHLETEYVLRKNTEIYWDDLALFCYPNEYELGITKIEEGDIIEIDSIKELAKTDKNYRRFFNENN